MGPDFYKHALMQAPLGYAFHEIIQDENGNAFDYRFLEVNKAFEDLTGLNADEITGKTAREVLPGIESSGFNWIEQYGKVALRGENKTFEQFSEPLQQQFQVQAFSPQKNYFITLFSNITEQLNKKEKDHSWKMLEKNQRHKALLKAIPDFMFVMDTNGQFLDVHSKSNEKLLAPPEKITGKNIADFFPSGEAQKQKELYRECLKDQALKVYKYSLTIRGEKNHFEARITPIDGNRLLAIVRDTTSEVMASLAHEEELAFRRFLFENTRDGLVLFNEDHQVVEANKRFCSMLGYPREELIGMHTWDFDDFLDEKQVRRDFETPAAFDKTFETRHRRKDGSTFDVEVAATKYTWLGQQVVYCSCRDISERKQQEHYLKESRANLQAILDNSLESIFTINQKGELQYANKVFNEEFYKTFGIAITPETKLTAVVPKAIRERWTENSKKILANKSLCFKEKIHLGGKDTFLEVAARPVIVEGKVTGASFFGRDITGQVRKSEALKKSEARFRQMADLSQTVIWEIDSNGLYTFVSPVAKKVWGYSPKEVTGKFRFYELHPEKGREAYTSKTMEKIKKKEIFHDFFNPVEKPSGEILWVKTNGMPLTDKHGKLIGYQGSDEDVTERLKAEKAMKESERFAHAVANTTPALLHIYDIREEKNIWTNHVFQEIFSPPTRHLENSPEKVLSAFVHPDDLKPLKRELYELIHNPGIKTISKEMQIKFKGVWKWMKAIYSVFKTNPEGEALQVLGALFDIDSRKRGEIELKKAKEKAEESDRLKTAFLHNMSHEVRTPMNGILGFLELLKEPNLSEKVKNQYLQMIDQSSQRLLHTINDIIELSQIEAGETEIEISKVDVLGIIHYQYDLFRSQTEQKGLAFEIQTQIPPDAAIIRTDKQKLNTILFNLLSNALKFTSGGSIIIGSYLQGNSVCFFVKDTGKGIPPQRQESVFDPFVQADMKINRGHEGSGIGLSIVKAYVEMLRGKIWLESEEGKGTTFRFFLPVNGK